MPARRRALQKSTMNSDPVQSKQDTEFEEALGEFHSSILAATARPESYWAAQRDAVLTRIGRPRGLFAGKPVLVLGAALAMLLTIVGIWFGTSRPLPKPDIAAGYDQDLLLDVERLTEAQTSLALEPAQLLVGEIAEGKEKPMSPRRNSILVKLP